ncbi:hypothetical protein DPX16_19388 [Anabarilius grahami]|uniref:Uncharacterized protein n=1 Tax=Anabarilius grahami TaxID=495550 RepID=A0A3N0YZZ3_ANAGA|nr:hypothetical protein DPX16_19388 [Anabarilius grahami]
MSHFLQATLLEEIFKDAQGSSRSSITGQRGVQRRGPEDQPAHSSQAANSDTEHKHPWGGDQAVACYENRAVEGIKIVQVFVELQSVVTAGVRADPGTVCCRKRSDSPGQLVRSTLTSAQAAQRVERVLFTEQPVEIHFV